MLLIGTMNLTRTKSTGDFYCPTCGSLQEYRLRARRPFLTIYFVPVVPIGAAEDFVQCSHCKTNSPVEALEVDEKAFRESQNALFRQSLFHAAVMVVTADDTISGAEIETLIDLGNQILPEGMDREQLGAICSSTRLNRIPPTNYIKTVSRPWSTAQKRTALQAIFLAATAEGKLEKPQLKLLTWLREEFGMSEREYEAAIEQAVDSGLDLAASTV
jgi:hypothetical protein